MEEKRWKKDIKRRISPTRDTQVQDVFIREL